MSEFKYPIYKQSKHSGIVIEFQNLNCGKVVFQGDSNFEVGYFGSHWENHTNLGWIDVTDQYKDKAEIPPLKMCGTHCSVEEKGHNNGGKTDYYDLPVGSENLQDLIEHKNMSWNIANVFKAMYRYSDNHHSTKIRDLYKAKWFIEREINLQLKVR